MSAVIYEDAGGGRYYERDLKEDSKGLYLYDEYDRCDVYFEDDRDNRGRSRSRDNRSRDNRTRGDRDRGRKNYKLDKGGDYLSPLSNTPTKGKVMEITKVKTSAANYEELEKMQSFKKHVRKTDLYNGLIHCKSLEVGSRLSLTYPTVSLLDKDTIEVLIKYLNNLVLKPDTLYEGIELSKEEDKFLARLVELSFKGVVMSNVTKHFVNLMEMVGPSNKGWDVLKERLTQLKESGSITTNVFILPERFITPVMNLLTGTDSFKIPSELKEKLNLGYAGYMLIGNVVYDISYQNVKLFMVL